MELVDLIDETVMLMIMLFAANNLQSIRELKDEIICVTEEIITS